MWDSFRNHKRNTRITTSSGACLPKQSVMKRSKMVVKNLGQELCKPVGYVSKDSVSINTNYGTLVLCKVSQCIETGEIKREPMSWEEINHETI